MRVRKSWEEKDKCRNVADLDEEDAGWGDEDTADLIKLVFTAQVRFAVAMLGE